MAEKIISPGVFTNEIDQSFLPSAVADIGACIIGPTVKGPAGIPTVVTSYQEYQSVFGDVIRSGSDSFQFLTSHAAEEYLKNSDTLTVIRIMDGTFGPATAEVSSSADASTVASASLGFFHQPTGSAVSSSIDEISIGSVDFLFVSESAGFTNSATQVFVEFVHGDTDPATQANLGVLARRFRDAINNNILDGTITIPVSASVNTEVLGANDSNVHITSSGTGTGGNLEITTGSSFGARATFGANTYGFISESTPFGSDMPSDGEGGSLGMQGGSAGDSSATSFILKTRADGAIMNNAEYNGGDATTEALLTSGSVHNVRFEVSNVNNNKGSFSVIVRRGNDNRKRKQILETFTNVTLDPNSPNYIAKAIGDQRFTVRDDGTTKYLQLTGSYPNKSNFVTVEQVNQTVDYLDENGNIRLGGLLSASLPAEGSGSSNGGFGGGADGVSGLDVGGIQRGTLSEEVTFYDRIGFGTTAAQTQGFKPTDLITLDGGAAYSEALDLIANQDEFDVNLIMLPGLIHNLHAPITNKAIDVCEDRGDCFAIIDPIIKGKNVGDATTEAEKVDSNFAGMYWPWVQVPDSQVAGTVRWVPPSVVLGGIYAFNDKVAHPWFAPAGLNRGGITTAIQAERKLTQGERDTLYDSNINPIATFPGQGVTVFGQKTLQKKSSALDRINVRRLLIRVKKFIASSSRFLVFEQNTAATRRRFLGIVNPFLENVQAQSGLNAFRVVMDETNNTPDTIDRNQLIGQLFLQPTRTAEFIVLDFTIQPTGASFPE